MGSFTIDPAYVEKLIIEMAEHGSDGGTGVSRTVYSPEWVGATRQYAQWCEEAGLETRHDAVGSVWGRLNGSEGGKAFVTGSHIDSQTPGGRYDGILGALAGIVALKALKETYGQPRRTIECVALCEEENSRFPTAQWWGSRAITGRTTSEDPELVRAFSGETIAEAMRDVGLDPARIPEAKRDDIEGFIELHIEQGPILEQAGLPVAIVTGVTGIRHYMITLNGQQNHAGAFPMDMRRDPMAGFAEIALGVIDTAHRWGRPAVTTVGRVKSIPNGIAVVPGTVEFSIDARHPDPAKVEGLYAAHEGLMREVAARRGLELSWEVLNDQPPCMSDPGILAHMKAAAEKHGVPTMTMASGAGHDTQQMARIAKVAMIFVRSKDGRSHTPDEFSSIPDIVEGIKVLTETLYRLAY
ncbi:Zn-dependent hydrolase [Arsenicitalea aurantiaca]|uniref:Zn-dependent hydrolase n=1 Tax=Arsenicitalea aurantiaca TaxID=1783274 RepID=A0A433XKF6_9HYPH|nr:Zn-dependent hydrolase [Arsenicitalea aurantiaca]RUT34572.1 Zn-dependent hydrolase [Arsenicitalea aurantiaca]